jgi:hypothetical protein
MYDVYIKNKDDRGGEREEREREEREREERLFYLKNCWM